MVRKLDPDFLDVYQAIEGFTAHLVVMGLGYVGLPLLTEFARVGFHVTGYDPDEKKVSMLRSGTSYLEYPDSEALQDQQALGHLEVTTDPAILGTADVVIICVPTPLNKTKEPDLSYVSQAVAELVKHQKPGQLIILESTTYPGTTRELVLPALTESFEVGKDVFVGYSPERIDPGNPTHNLTNTPKVVSGVTANCVTLVEKLYAHIGTVVPVSSPEVAEMAKVLENTFRAVNIGLANEVALISKKLCIDPFEVIDAAATKPFGFMPFYPGPGLGGHCIPVDPLYLSWKLRALQTQARFIDLADTINSGMPDHVVGIVTEALNDKELSVKGSSILVVGVSYKPDVSDMRESPVLPIIQKLMAMGASVSYEDPLVSEIAEYSLALKTTVVRNYGKYDVVVVTTPHREIDLGRILLEARTIVDTRGVFRDASKRPLRDPKIHRI